MRQHPGAESPSIGAQYRWERPVSSVVAKLDARLYPGVESNWDDRLFRKTILSYVDARSVVLDLGAGSGIVPQMNFKGVVGRVCGVDLDPRVVLNPFLDEGRVSDAESIPYGASEFDLVFSDNVMEHIDNPAEVFAEVARVLKPGGVFLFKTPNRAHYMPMIARITPHWFHQWVNKKRGRAEVDTFPTRYRVNSPDAIHRWAGAVGLKVLKIGLVESRPEYLRMAWPLYLVGAAYERLVNSTDRLARFRILLIGQLKKPLEG